MLLLSGVDTMAAVGRVGRRLASVVKHPGISKIRDKLME